MFKSKLAPLITTFGAAGIRHSHTWMLLDITAQLNSITLPIDSIHLVILSFLSRVANQRIVRLNFLLRSLAIGLIVISIVGWLGSLHGGSRTIHAAMLIAVLYISCSFVPRLFLCGLSHGGDFTLLFV